MDKKNSHLKTDWRMVSYAVGGIAIISSLIAIPIFMDDNTTVQKNEAIAQRDQARTETKILQQRITENVFDKYNLSSGDRKDVRDIFEEKSDCTYLTGDRERELDSRQDTVQACYEAEEQAYNFHPNSIVLEQD